MDNQLTIIDQAKKGLAEIQNLKAQIDEIGLNCQQISITDDLSLAIGQNNLAKANNMLTLVEAKRKDLKQPYLDAGKLVDNTAKLITEELNKGIGHIKTEVGNWEKTLQAKAKKKADELAAKLDNNQITPETAANQFKVLQESASLNKTKNIRYTWDFELVDINSVPLDWLMIDPEKVKEYIKENKDKFKEEQVRHGIKFFKKMIVTA